MTTDLARLKAAIGSMSDMVQRCLDTLQETQQLRELLNQAVINSRAGAISRSGHGSTPQE